MVLVLAIKSSVTSQNEGESAIQGRSTSGASESDTARKERAHAQDATWNVGGDQLKRCSTAHARQLTNTERTFCSLRDGERTSFQELVLLWSLHCLSEATQLGESPETAFARLVREGRGEARVSTLNSRREAGTGSHETRRCSNCHSSTALMRWVITRTPVTSLKSRMVVLGFTDSWERKPLHHRHCHDVVDSPSLIVAGSQCSKPMQRRPSCKGQLKIKNLMVSWLQNCRKHGAWNTSLYIYEKSGVRVDGRTLCFVGKSRERHDKSRMENLNNRAVFLGQNFV